MTVDPYSIIDTTNLISVAKGGTNAIGTVQGGIDALDRVFGNGSGLIISDVTKREATIASSSLDAQAIAQWIANNNIVAANTQTYVQWQAAGFPTGKDYGEKAQVEIGETG